MNRAELEALVDARLNTNGVQDITAAELREVFLELLGSITLAGEAPAQIEPTYVSAWVWASTGHTPTFEFTDLGAYSHLILIPSFGMTHTEPTASGELRARFSKTNGASWEAHYAQLYSYAGGVEDVHRVAHIFNFNSASKPTSSWQEGLEGYFEPSPAGAGPFNALQLYWTNGAVFTGGALRLLGA